MKRRLRVGLIVVLSAYVALTTTVAGSAQLSAAATDPVPPNDGIYPERPLEDQLRFRRDFGLEANSSAAEDALSFPSSRRAIEYGVPLTQPEQDDLEARHKVEDSISELKIVVDAMADRTGGLYIDQSSGGQLVVLAAGALSDEDRSRLAAAAPVGGRLRIDNAAISSSRMAAAINRLSEALGRWTSQGAFPDDSLSLMWSKFADVGLKPTGLGPIPATNELEVNLRGFTDADAKAAYEIWDRYASDLVPITALKFAHAEATAGTGDTRLDSPGRVKGGLETVGVNFCTSNIGIINSAGTRYLLSAGHCAGPPGTVGTAVAHASYPLGSFSNNLFAGTTNSDAGLVLLAPGALASPTVLTAFAGQTPRATTLTGVHNPVAGAQACMDGRTSGPTVCGTIFDTNRTFISHEGPTITNQSRTSFTYVGGDSGGPIGFSGVAFGIVGRNDGAGRGIFTPISNALAAWGVSPIITTPGEPESFHSVVARHSGKCLDVAVDSAANGALVQQWQCNGGNAQNWSLVPRLFSDGSGNFLYELKRNRFLGGVRLCLDMDTTNYAHIQQWQCNGGNNQLWRLERVNDPGSWRAINYHFGICIDIVGSSGADGAGAQGYPCLGKTGTYANQHFHL